MAYCQNCGHELGPNSLYCFQCGQKISGSAPAKTIQPETQNTSRAYMVLQVSKKDGLLKTTTCYLVFFSDIIAVSVLTNDIMKSENARLQEAVKAEGKGFFQGSAAMMRYWGDYGNQYYSMGQAEILNRSRENIAIPNNRVDKIMFSSRDSRVSGEQESVSYGELDIQYNQGLKLKCTHNYGDANKNIKRVLEMLYGSRLKYRGTLLSIQIGGNKDGFI